MAESAIGWHLITGEYPPDPGGVSDYTRLLARELAAAGDRVEVWTPENGAADGDDNGVAVHRLRGHFGPSAIAALDVALRHSRGRILVQYVPHAYGLKAMNFPFVFWLYARRRLGIAVMFHEMAFPIGRSRPLRHNLLGVSTRAMAAIAARAASQIYVATSSWERYLQPAMRNGHRVVCLPMPSNIPVVEDRAAIEAVRARCAAGGGPIVGHFGTFGAGIAALLDQTLPPLLENVTRASALLIGRGSMAYREALLTRHPSLASRIHAVGGLGEREVSAHIGACDLMLQPYPDGISTRRTSSMAVLSHGIPIATTSGHLTESLWAESVAVALVPVTATDELVLIAAALLNDEVERRRLASAGRKLYQDRFDIMHTVSALRRCA